MSATLAATRLAALVDLATTMPVVIGALKQTDSQTAEQARPYVRLLLQQTGNPTTVPNHREGVMAVFVYGLTEIDAFHQANLLVDALSLANNAPHGPGTTGTTLRDYLIDAPIRRLPDPTPGGLVSFQIRFRYFG